MSAEEQEQPEEAPPAPAPVPMVRPGPKPAPAFQRREMWIKLPEPYAGWQMRVWLNHPTRVGDEVESFDEAVRISALGKVFLEHNSWPDPLNPDEVLPAPSTKEFWERVPDEAVGILLALLSAEKNRVPNSIRRHRGD